MKVSKKQEILLLKLRIEELEEKICPCESHDFVNINYEFVGGTGRGDETTIYYYKCRKCGKKIKSWKILNTMSDRKDEVIE